MAIADPRRAYASSWACRSVTCSSAPSLSHSRGVLGFARSMNRRLLVAALLAAAIAAVAVGAGCELILPPGELNSVDAVAPDGDAQPQRCPLTVKPMQSCLGDAGTICGPEGDASCCLSLPVEGGTFTRSGY